MGAVCATEIVAVEWPPDTRPESSPDDIHRIFRQRRGETLMASANFRRSQKWFRDVVKR
jgi:hypothetical protein